MTSLRASFTSRPALIWRALVMRPDSQPSTFSVTRPVRSMISIHDTPANSDTPASHSASISSVAPRKLRPASSPVPTNEPSTPPAELGYRATVKCRLASPQLVMSVSTKPTARNATVAREGVSALLRSW